MSKLVQKRERMLAMVSAWRPSNQTKLQYCQENNISKSTFDYWRKKSNRANATEESFIKVKPEAQPISHIEVHYPNGVHIVANHDLVLLRQLIHLY